MDMGNKPWEFCVVRQDCAGFLARMRGASRDPNTTRFTTCHAPQQTSPKKILASPGRQRRQSREEARLGPNDIRGIVVPCVVAGFGTCRQSVLPRKVAEEGGAPGIGGGNQGVEPLGDQGNGTMGIGMQVGQNLGQNLCGTRVRKDISSEFKKTHHWDNQSVGRHPTTEHI